MYMKVLSIITEMKGIIFNLQIRKCKVSVVTQLRQKWLPFHLLFEGMWRPLLPKYLYLQLEVETVFNKYSH